MRRRKIIHKYFKNKYLKLAALERAYIYTDSINVRIGVYNIAVKQKKTADTRELGIINCAAKGELGKNDSFLSKTFKDHTPASYGSDKNLDQNSVYVD